MKTAFQTFRRHCLHAHQSAPDVGRAHGVQKPAVFGGFHGDLREERQVARQIRQPLHQLESLFADGLQFLDLMLVALPLGVLDVGERDRVEVVVGQRDETESQAAQRHDLLDHHIGGALPRLLAVGAPDRTERAVLGAAANRLHRRPHVTVRRQQVPARGFELLRRHAAAFVDFLRRVARAIAQRLRPTPNPHRLLRPRARAPIPELPPDRAWRECRRKPRTRRVPAPGAPRRSHAAHCRCGCRCRPRRRPRCSPEPGFRAFRHKLPDRQIRSGVAVANTYSQRGVMTAVPNAESLGLIRCIVKGPFLGALAKGSAHWRKNLQPQPDSRCPGCQGL